MRLVTSTVNILVGRVYKLIKRALLIFTYTQEPWTLLYFTKHFNIKMRVRTV
jgi:hypothetical protein